MKNKGYIYILKNPSFEDFVKIGYATDVKARLQQLNRSECVPFAFRVYATYEVDVCLADKNIHSIIDKLNPDLRSIDTVDGHLRKREFFAMSAEKAYSILEAMAEIHNCQEKLIKWEMTDEEAHEEEAADIIAERRARSSNFTFSECEIPKGATLEYIHDSSVVCTVVDDRRIEYNGEVMYITPFVKMISGKTYITKGPKYLVEHFKYKGSLLEDIEGRC
ncbi:MAG: GIY-YIG nuclease family protein [Clostridia bacterium]|nr:GIY-YIG nuclease family protein [Clostridia bacterium]